jgi:hypothetical protein
MRRLRIAISCFFFGLAAASGQTTPVVTQVTPQQVTPQELNAAVAQEAMLQVVAVIAQNLGGPFTPDQLTGNTTGTINAAGFNLTYTGSVFGTGVTVGLVGQLNSTSNLVSWTLTGTAGQSPLTGSGTMDGGGNWAFTINWKKLLFGIAVSGAQAIASAGTGTLATLGIGIASKIIISIAGLTVAGTNNSSVTDGSILSSTMDFGGVFALAASGTMDPTTGLTSFQPSLTPSGLMIFRPINPFPGFPWPGPWGPLGPTPFPIPCYPPARVP